MAAANTNVSAKFLRSHAVTAAWEGGYVDHPEDPGGKTDRGVTQGLYDAWRKKRGLATRPVRGITEAEAQQVYWDEFWAPLRAEGLAHGVDLAAYDASVNSGLGRGRKWLMASIGGSDVETARKICDKRLGFVQTLGNFRTFGRGWSRRIADIKAKSMAWALAATDDNHVVAAQLEDEAGKAKARADKQATGAAAGGGAGTGAVTTDQATTNAADWLLTGIGVLIFVAAAYLVVRYIINRQQAEAFAKEARSL